MNRLGEMPPTDLQIQSQGLLKHCSPGRMISAETGYPAHFYSTMADECTDITTLEELSIFYRWVEKGVSLEHFLGIKKADAVTIPSTLIKFLNEKEI